MNSCPDTLAGYSYQFMLQCIISKITGNPSFSLEDNSDDFIFDNQMLLQVISHGFAIGEITCPTRYTQEASSIGGLSAVRYGLGVLLESVLFRLDKMGIVKTRYRKS